ncbi:MAG TPA: hypothetical protein PL141_03430 [Thermoflexales bacterium]|nr:hypothetical protein [Thermoflexales bacterium]
MTAFLRRDLPAITALAVVWMAFFWRVLIAPAADRMNFAAPGVSAWPVLMALVAVFGLFRLMGFVPVAAVFCAITLGFNGAFLSLILNAPRPLWQLLYPGMAALVFVVAEVQMQKTEDGRRKTATKPHRFAKPVRFNALSPRQRVALRKMAHRVLALAGVAFLVMCAIAVFIHLLVPEFKNLGAENDRLALAALALAGAGAALLWRASAAKPPVLWPIAAIALNVFELFTASHFLGMAK